MIGVSFFCNSILLGVGLSMDAFSVSLANGLNEPRMKKGRMCAIAGVFAFFQALMPMLGWVCVHTIINTFHAFAGFIPWIALGLLSCIGGKMLLAGLRGDETEGLQALGVQGLMLQGVATSIDALSVGFTIADYDGWTALAVAMLIAAVTFVVCVLGLKIGKRLGTRLAGKAEILGGVILIGIGLEIFLTGVL